MIQLLSREENCGTFNDGQHNCRETGARLKGEKMERMNDKIAMVTGGASGLGAGIAKRFVEEGARTVITDINPEGEAVAVRLGAEFLTQDVCTESSWVDAIDEVIARFGRLDVLVNMWRSCELSGRKKNLPSTGNSPSSTRFFADPSLLMAAFRSLSGATAKPRREEQVA